MAGNVALHAFLERRLLALTSPRVLFVTELTELGESAIRAWAGRDPTLEQRLASSATVLVNAEAAVDESGLSLEHAKALGEAVRQFEHGSIAALMQLTPLVADSARRVLEAVYFTVFLRAGPLTIRRRVVTLLSWHTGDVLYSFKGPLRAWAGRHPSADRGPYGSARVEQLYGDVSGYVHNKPTYWGESRRGLAVSASPVDVSRHIEWLIGCAKAAIYITLAEFPDLWIDGVDAWFGHEWPDVKRSLKLP